MSRLTLVIAAVVAGACLVYAIWIEPRWIQVSMHDVRTDPAQDRIRIVQLSDLHLQPGDAGWSPLIQKIEGVRPDVIVLSGDVIDRADALPALGEFLAKLGDVTVIAVLGNWEHWSGVDLEALRAVYEKRPSTHLLVNGMLTLSIRARSIHIVGFDDFTAGLPDAPSVPMPPVEDYVVVVQHSPGFFEREGAKMGDSEFDLCLSGHTHGGQVTFFGLPLWRPPGSGPFHSGFYETPYCRLFVSRGVGTSLLPIRFGARPEIAVFDL